MTLSSKDVYTEGNVKHAATIDYWRGYVNDENQIPSYGTIVKYSVWNEKHGGSLNGFNVETNKDEKNPDNFDQDYLEGNYKSYE